MSQGLPFDWLDAFFEAGVVELQQGNLSFPHEHRISFQGPGVTLADDPTNDRTIVTIANGNTTTTTTATFVQPAVLGTVTVPVTSTSALAPGLAVFIAGGGYYAVSSITDGTHFVAQNLGLTGNAAPTTNVTSPALVIPVGPANSLEVENNGTLLTVRSIINFFGGLVASDNSGSGRTDVTLSTGSPLSITSAQTMTTGQPWAEFQAFGGTIKLPATPIVGQLLELTHVPGGSFGSTLSGGGRVTLDGNGHNLENPQDRFGLGVTSPDATVPLSTDFMTYRYRYNGSIFRCVN